MLIDVYPSAAQIPERELEGRVAVVIDALRATTTITRALANGARRVIPVLTPEEALQVSRSEDDPALLGGERDGVLIPGFDLSNSPGEYTAERVRGRTIIFTTTNGTRAIRGAASAEHVLICSFLNVPAVAGCIAELGLDAAICCAGARDQLSLEDTACAGALVHMLGSRRSDVELGDLAYLSAELYRQFKGRLVDLFRIARHGKILLGLGFEEDLHACAQFGTLSVVPAFRGGQVEL